MKEITLSQEELNEILTSLQEQRELVMQMPKDNYIFNVIVKDGKLLLGFTPQNNELVAFNIVNKEGKLLFDEGVIFIFISGKDVVKVGTKNGEIISIDNIICK